MFHLDLIQDKVLVSDMCDFTQGCARVYSAGSTIMMGGG